MGLPVHQVGCLPRHAQPSYFLPCHLFWLVVRHDNDDHHDGIEEGMKRKTVLNIGEHVESLAPKQLCQTPEILLLFHRTFTKDLSGDGL